MGTSAIAAIIAKQKHIVEAFRRAGAMSASGAVPPATLGVSEGLAFRKLREHAVLREASPGRFYLDVPSWQALCLTRRRLALAAVLLILGAAIAVWLKVS